MKRLVLLICLVAVPFLFSSCSVTQYASAQEDYNSFWAGRSYADIIKAYGAPARETSDGQNGVILIYEQAQVVSTTEADYPLYGYGPYPYYRRWGIFGPSLRTVTATTNDYVHFYITEDNVCYAVKTNQMKPVGEKVDGLLTTMAVIGGISFTGVLLGFLVPFF